MPRLYLTTNNVFFEENKTSIKRKKVVDETLDLLERKYKEQNQTHNIAISNRYNKRTERT